MMAVSCDLLDNVGPVRMTGNWVSGSLLVVKDPAPPGGCCTPARVPLPRLGSKVVVLPEVLSISRR